MKESNLAYSLFIKCEIDGVEQFLGLDYVDDNSNYNVNSDITTHPLVNGDIIADHMYIRASTANYSGTFSLIGNKKGIIYVTQDDEENVLDYSNDINSRLSMIQKLFERINRDGILCTIIRRSTDGDDSRFLVRENMALTSITWTEHQYSVDFSFGFTEVLTAVVEEEIYDVQVDDSDLPTLTTPVQADLSDTLININDFKEYIIDYLTNLELNNTFIHNLKMAWKWITTCGISKLMKNIDEEKNYEKLRKLKKLPEDKIEELATMFLNKFNSLEKYISLYTINQNIDQQSLITIDNTLYCFTFKKSSQNSNYSLTVTHLDNATTQEISDKEIGNVYEYSITSLGLASPNNLIFETKENTKCFIVFLYQEDSAPAINLREFEDKFDKKTKDISNYGIVFSTIDLYHYDEILQSIFEECLNEIEV